MFLGLQPTDAIAIRIACVISLGLLCFFTLVWAWFLFLGFQQLDLVSWSYPDPAWYQFVGFAACLLPTVVATLALAPRLVCGCCTTAGGGTCAEQRAMTPRASLRRLWLSIRCSSSASRYRACWCPRGRR